MDLDDSTVLPDKKLIPADPNADDSQQGDKEPTPEANKNGNGMAKCQTEELVANESQNLEVARLLQPEPDTKVLDDDKPLEVGGSAPNDAYYTVFIVFALHGIGILLPWNMFINAHSYFVDYKLYTNVSANADYRSNFMHYITLSAQLPNMLMMAFNVFFQPTKPSLKSSNDVRKLMLVILIEIGICLFTVALAVVDSSQWPATFFGITIACIVLLNCCAGVYQSSAYGMAALLPMAYSNAIVLGNNVSGTVISLVNLASKAASSLNLQLTAILYFSAAVIILLICFGSLFLLPKLSFYQHYQAREFEIPMLEFDETANSNGKPDGGNGTVCESAEPTVAVVDVGGDGCCDDYSNTAVECCALCCLRGGDSKLVCSRYWRRYWEAFRHCWVHCVSVWCVFFCTLACFPALQATIEPVTLLSLKDWFVDIFVFLFFNLFAMLGSLVSTFWQWPSPRRLALCVWPRLLIFVPFFLMCNCFPDSRAVIPVLIRSDTAFICGMIVFALTSGYLSSLCMMYAPRSVADPEKHAGLAAMLAAFFLVFGVFTGILFGTLLKAMFFA
ncbi:hypothetical protein BOX15_Mlig032273g1 [Macrostomum lignano]|uniref:Uncharacterized protein n=2 Tax=Macrostomum lignano TaxID=282301 RepID=A0A267H084_9PLAT|nr:hypothetical protein BOX15_Mlig032273g1 [Macrostomum lignano]